MANRYQDQQSGRSRSNYRDWEDGGNEAEGSVRGGSYDQGRVQYGRDTDDNSGSTGRYAGYGDWGQGDYNRPGRGPNTGQNRYGQSGFGGGDYGSGPGNHPGDSGRGGHDRSNYGRSGDDNRGSGYGYGYGGSGNQGRGQRSWNEPYGEGQQYGGSDRGWDRGGSNYGGDSPYRDSQNRGAQSGDFHSGSGQSSGYGGPRYGGLSGAHRGKGPKGYQRSDDRIKEQISERLRDDPHIDASEITVTVTSGKVTLDGTVDSRQAKNAAEDIVEQCGCEDVQNNLRVQRSQESSTTGSSTNATSTSDKDKGESARQRH